MTLSGVKGTVEMIRNLILLESQKYMKIQSFSLLYEIQNLIRNQGKTQNRNSSVCKCINLQSFDD